VAKNSVGREPGSDNEKQETFRAKVCSYPWFCENTTKTFRAIRTVSMRVPEDHKLRFLRVSPPLPPQNFGAKSLHWMIWRATKASERSFIFRVNWKGATGSGELHSCA
jgi:hypothetical protein